MNTRYCPHCGKSHAYTVEKPKFCAKCNKDMDGAFASVSAPPAAQTIVYVTAPPANVAPIRRYVDAKGRDVSHLYAQPASAAPVRHQPSDEDYVDPYLKEQIQQELEASIKSSDFVMGLDEEASDKTTRLGDLIGPALAAQNAAAGKRRRSRKS
jgi:hypothetical protein